MNEPVTIPPLANFKDRSGGLVCFGVLTVLLGGLCALFVPLMIFGQSLAARTSGAPTDFAMILPAIVTYGLLAVVLVGLGIGSMMARRWARALLLIFSWSWLVMGVTGTGMMVVLFPKIMAAMESAQPAGQPPLPAGAMQLIMVIQFLMLTVMLVLLPAAWVLFYRSRHVQATCESRDPVAGWTDACPLPVLAVSLWLGLGMLMMLAMPLVYHGVFPFFGSFLSGVPGTLVWLGFAALWGYSARATYQLNGRGWWLVLLSIAALTLSNAITYSRHDLMELYQLMGYPEAQLQQLKKFNFLSGSLMVRGSLLSAVPLFGYLVYVKRFFRRSQ